MPIKVGDKLPAVTVTEGTPKDEVVISELFAGKKGVLFAVVGAFTPGCSMTHLPGYVENVDKLKAKGVDVIACVSVNDAFVMDAWGQQLGASGKIHMLADDRGALAQEIGLDIAVSPGHHLGTVRSKRYSMLLQDGIVKQLNVEPEDNPIGLTCSLAPGIMKQI